MQRAIWLAALLLSASCGGLDAPPPPPPPAPGPVPGPAPAPAPAPAAAAIDDGTYLERIDPLGGQWVVDRIGNEDFSKFKARIDFSAGGFLNHGAGCYGGYPAFYRLDGQAITITRREPIRTGKCPGATPAIRAAQEASERRLAAFLDQVATWQKPYPFSLILTAKDGTRALLTRPGEPQPDIAGRWIIESIGGKPFVTERRPPTLHISLGSISAYADCNRLGSQYRIPDLGEIVVAGPIIGTQMGCAAEDQAEDDLMARAMRAVTGYYLQGERLFLTGGPGMVVRYPPTPDRRLAGAYKSCGNTLLGGYHEGPITLAIDARTIRDNAGCVAEYSAEGPRLVLRLADRPACAATATPYVPGNPVSVGGAISTLAVTRPDGFGFTEDGTLVLRTHRGLLTLCRQGAPPLFGD